MLMSKINTFGNKWILKFQHENSPYKRCHFACIDCSGRVLLRDFLVRKQWATDLP